MLSLESIEQRLENPKAYYVFYQFFYKAAVGEVRWKECMDSLETRIGNDTTEAFALLLFANNYKAWLYEEKLNHGEALWTEYDSVPTSVRRESIVDRLLFDLEFVLDKDAEELVVRDPTKQTYKKATKARKDWLTALKRLPICTEMRNTWQQTARAEEIDENEPNAGETPNKRERMKKRRKLMKGLKNGLVQQMKESGNSRDGQIMVTKHSNSQRWISEMMSRVECMLFGRRPSGTYIMSKRRQ